MLLLFYVIELFLICKYKEKQRGRATNNLDTCSIQVLTNTKKIKRKKSNNKNAYSPSLYTYNTPFYVVCYYVVRMYIILKWV